MLATTFTRFALLVATAGSVVGCTSPATEVLVVLDTDAPSDRALTITATVGIGDTPSSVARTWDRGGAGTASIDFPASFAVVPGGRPVDSSVTLRVRAHVAASSSGAPAIDFERIARFRFTPHATTVLPIFLPIGCGATTAMCGASACSVSDQCAMAGQTCGDMATCTSPDVTPVAAASMDASLNTYFDGVAADASMPACTIAPGWTATSLDNAPSARVSATFVWDGREVLVWGGISGSMPVATGARFDPATNRWTSTRVTGAPTGRRLHTAVWTGREMIVWGGNAVGDLGDGGIYDPASDTWRPMSTAGAPTARHQHTAVWTGSEMIVWGGEATSANRGDGARYDPTRDTWSPISMVGAPSPRSAHYAFWTGRSMIVWGGDSSSVNLVDGAIYDPSSDSWHPMSTTGATSPAIAPSAVWTGREMIVWGGRVVADEIDPTRNFGYSAAGARYDPTTDSWRPTSSVMAPEGRTNHGAVWTGSEMIVWGGEFSSVGSSGSNLHPTGGRYDPAMDQWTDVTTVNAPGGRWSGDPNPDIAWTGCAMVLWGGSDTSGELDTGGIYRP